VGHLGLGGLAAGQDARLRLQVLQEQRGLADRELRVPEDPFSPRNRRVAITVLMPTQVEAARAAAAGDLPTGTPADSAGVPLPAVLPGGPR
ncbi:MAG: hypothetical protein ABL977_10710, partial [Candidatus Eisenbacteria bacterium]